MRRTFLYATLVLIVVAATAAYWLANRRMIVERPMIGGPPIPLSPHESLIGKPAPKFAASYRGRVVVLTVWAPWCRPCVDELPRLERDVWQRYRRQAVVVGVALGEEAARIRDFNRQAKLTFPLVPDPSGEIAQSFGANHQIPQTFVISRSGTVVYETLGYDSRGFERLVSAVDREVAR